ncbi:MAG: YeiH family putative sulfate export transporter, partial [Orrella sp.]
MTATTTIDSPGWRDKFNGVLFVALLTMAVVQLAELPFVRSMGISPLVI